MADYRNDQEATLALINSHIDSLFKIKPKAIKGSWTTEEGEDTWCISVDDRVLTPARICRNSIAGERFVDGWRVEVVSQYEDFGTGVSNIDWATEMQTCSLADAITHMLIAWLEENSSGILYCRIDGWIAPVLSTE